MNSNGRCKINFIFITFVYQWNGNWEMNTYIWMACENDFIVRKFLTFFFYTSKHDDDCEMKEKLYAKVKIDIKIFLYNFLQHTSLFGLNRQKFIRDTNSLFIYFLHVQFPFRDYLLFFLLSNNEPHCYWNISVIDFNSIQYIYNLNRPHSFDTWLFMIYFSIVHYVILISHGYKNNHLNAMLLSTALFVACKL